MGRVGRIGEIVGGRWVALGSVERREGRVVHVRDRRWSNVRLSWIERPAETSRALFQQGALRWLDLPPHPGLLAGFGPRELDGEVVCLTDQAPGPDLAEFLDEHTPSPERALAWSARLADAVRVLHAADLIHGTVDPRTCQVDPDGELRLAGLPLGGSLPGTIGFVAPEGPGTPAADVFAAAAVIYRLLTGFEPYGPSQRARRRWLEELAPARGGWARLSAWIRGGDPLPPALFDLLRRPAEPGPAALQGPRSLSLADARLVALLQEHCPPLSPSHLGIALPPDVEAVLLRSLARDPADRPDAATLAAALVAASPLPPDPRAVRTSVLAALSWDDLGDPDRAVAGLEDLQRALPDNAHAWANLALLRQRDRPERSFDLLDGFEAIRGRCPWDDALERFATALQQRMLRVDGVVRSVAVCSEGDSVILGGAFPGGARIWAVGDQGGTQPVRAGASEVQEVHCGGLLGEGVLLMRAGGSVLRVDGEGSRPRWVAPVGEPVGMAVLDREIAVVVRDGPGSSLILLDASTGAIRGREPGIRGAWRVGGVRVTWEGDELRWAGQTWPLQSPPRAVVATDDRLLLATDRGLFAAGPDGIELLDPAPADRVAAWGQRVVVARGDQARVLGGPDFPAAGRITALGIGPDHVIVADVTGRVRRWPLNGEETWPLPVPVLDAWSTGPVVRREVGERTLLRQERGGAVLLGVLNVRRDWGTAYDFPVAALAFDVDRTLLAVATERTVSLSRVVGRAVHLDVRQLQCGAPVRGLALSPDASYLAAALGEAVPLDTPLPGGLPLSARLRVREEGGLTFSVPIGPAGLTIGRSRDRDLVIPDPQVSRRHCTVRWIGGRCVVRDDGSANGFLVNGQRTWEAILEPGDTIQLGPVALTFVVEDDAALATEPAAPERASSRHDEVPTLMVDQETLSALEIPAGRADVAVVWRVGSREAPRVLTGHEGAVRAVRFLGDGALVTAGDDGVLRRWSPTAPRPLLELGPVGAAAVTCLAASADGRWVLAGYDDRVARIWDLQRRLPVRELTGHLRGVGAVALTHDARYALTGSLDGTARIWSCQTGETLRVLSWHTGAVTAVAFSDDGRMVLTASEDGRLCLGHRFSGELLEEVEVGGDGITTLAFSPDGRSLVLGGRDGTVQVWLVRWMWATLEDLVQAAEALFDPRAGPCVTWPHTERNLDFWLDVWADLLRCARGEPGALAGRLAAVQARVRVEITRRVPTPAQGALGTAIGFGVPAGPTDDALRDPLAIVGRVDADLAGSLRKPW